MTKAGRSSDRRTRWTENFSKHIRIFPERLQKDLLEIKLPAITDVHSTYFWGAPGTGKTIKAANLLLNWNRNNFVELISATSAFITVPELLYSIKATYKPNPTTTEDAILQKYSSVDLLVLDDLGAQNTTDWSYQILYLIINRRYESMRTTIVTSNYDLDELGSLMEDGRIPSRLEQMCEVLETTKQHRKENKWQK